MRRRTFLSLAGLGSTGSLAGCTGLTGAGDESTSTPTVGEPPTVTDRPNAVYYPTHVEGMVMAGMATQGDYKCALGYSFPHRFWLVTGQDRKQVSLSAADSMHLMPVVWDAETGIVPPDTNPQVSISRNGEQITSLSPWPMLSQPMGFHFGDNVKLPAKETYQVEISVSSSSTKRTGALADRDHDPATFSFDLTYSDEQMDDIMVKEVPKGEQGTKGAVDPMGMKMMPSTQVPAPDSLPGTVRGEATSGDARFVVTTFTDAGRFGGSSDEAYLAVSPRTPYNRYMLPMMSLSATLARGSETVYDDILLPTIDSELQYHYGAVVSDVQSGDDLTITVDAPPQTARHEGYETAFFEMPAMQLTL